jgi:hypothetical protein
MNVSRHLFVIVFLFLMGTPLSSSAITGEQIVRLKAAGVSDTSIQMMIQEKSIETVSLTVDEVLQMKAAGIDEETLQLMIQSLSFLKNSRPVVYRAGRNDIPLTSVDDLLQLKAAGISDKTLRAIVTIASGDRTRDGYEDALRILENMNIWITPRHKAVSP